MSEPTIVLWAVAYRLRSGGSWDVLSDIDRPIVFSDKRMADRRVRVLEDEDGDVFFYMTLPMQGHPLLAAATPRGQENNER